LNKIEALIVRTFRDVSWAQISLVALIYVREFSIIVLKLCRRTSCEGPIPGPRNSVKFLKFSWFCKLIRILKRTGGRNSKILKTQIWFYEMVCDQGQN